MPKNYNSPNGYYKGIQQFKVNKNNFLFNVDTLHFTVNADNYDENINSSGLLDKLIEGRDHYYDNESPQKLEIDLRGYDNKIIFEIFPPHNAKMYQYQLRNEDMAFYFMKKKRKPTKLEEHEEEEDGSITFPIKVQINQFKLWEKGCIEAFYESLYVLAELGFLVSDSKPSRIDLCCHTDQWNFLYTDFIEYQYPLSVKGDNHPHFLRLNPNTDEFETMYHGDRSRLQQRIYLKSKEILDNKKYHFIDLYKEKGLRPDKVWNIEFECRRSFLKTFVHPITGKYKYYDTMDNLLSEGGLNLLWTHLTSNYGFENPFWDTVRNGDKNKFFKTQLLSIRESDISTKKMPEVAQIRGRIMKMALTEEVAHGFELDYCIMIFKELLEEYQEEKDKDFSEEFDHKRRLYMDKKINGLSNAKKILLKYNQEIIKKESRPLN